MRFTIKLIDGAILDVSGFHCDTSIDNLISRGGALRFGAECGKQWDGSERTFSEIMCIPAHSVLWIKEAKQND